MMLWIILCGFKQNSKWRLDESFEFIESLTFDVIFATEKHTVLSLHQIPLFRLSLLLVFQNYVPKHVVNEVQVIQ